MEQNNQEFDENKVDWYQTDQGGQPVVTLKDKLMPKAKPVIIVVASILVSLLAIVLVYSAVKYFYSTSDAKKIEQDTMLYIEACQSQKDVQKCIDNASPQLAQETGNKEYCTSLTGDRYDSCLVLSALTSHLIDDCKGIQNIETKNQCNDAITALTLPLNYTYEDCSDYIDSNNREQCQASWVFDTMVAGDCGHPQITSQMCEDGAKISEAITKRNPDICDDITDILLARNCIELTSPGDRDFDNVDADEETRQGTSDTDSDSDDDGLMDGEELFKYNTDPTNADTDGDGYSDGEEVLSGHDPLK
ncbi:MAG: thrombospondin type 3 repeat-containing protein [Patescibacteria group bacterium]